MQSNTALRFRFTPIRMATNVKQMTVNADRNMKKEKTFVSADENEQLSSSHYANYYVVSTKHWNKLPYDPAVPSSVYTQCTQHATGMLAYLWSLLDYSDYLESRTNQEAHWQLKKKKMWSIFIAQFYADIMTNTIIMFVEKRDSHVKQSQTQKENTTWFVFSLYVETIF